MPFVLIFHLLTPIKNSRLFGSVLSPFYEIFPLQQIRLQSFCLVSVLRTISTTAVAVKFSVTKCGKAACLTRLSYPIWLY
jgi:hypothetical protein